MTTYAYPRYVPTGGWWRRVIRGPVLPERLLAKLWRGKTGASLRTTDGQTVEVIYPGRPAPGHGPDFRDAILKLGPRTIKGPVELHRVPSDWKAHGHDTDRAYDNVVLHVVASTGETQSRPNNKATTGPVARKATTLTTTLDRDVRVPAYTALPTVVLATLLQDGEGALVEARRAGPLGALASLRNDALKERLRAAGMRRFEERVALAREALAVRSADSVLVARIADGLGYSENREPFAELIRRVPLTVLRAAGHTAPADQRAALIERLLLGGAGLARRTNEWDAIVGTAPMSASVWRSAGVRPANHPRRRLAALAHYVAVSDALGFAGWLEHPVAGGASALIQVLTVESTGTVAGEGSALVGDARAKEIAVNAVLPVLAAMNTPRMASTADAPLGTPAGKTYARFPALGGNTVLREALMLLGPRRGLRLGACEQLGLQRLYQEAVAPSDESADRSGS